MDYGQQGNCGSGQCCNYSSESSQRNIEDVVPGWLSKIMDNPELAFEPSFLRPVGADNFSRSVPTNEGGMDRTTFNATTRALGDLQSVADRFEEIKNTNLCKEINMQENVTRMEVTEENFFEMYYFAKLHGYTGTEEDFRQALNNREPIQLDYKETPVRPTPLQSFRNGYKEAMTIRREGVQGPAGKVGGVAAEGQFPKVVLETADPATLTNYVSKTIVPMFVKEISELTGKFEGIDLLRQQRRLQDRLNKLMMYSNKPERIVASAIHDEHEMAIYKCYIAKEVVARRIGLMAGQDLINQARAGLTERLAAVAANHAKQKAEQKRIELLKVTQNGLILLADDIKEMELSTVAMYLRKLADNLVGPEVTQPVTEKGLITKGVEQVVSATPNRSDLAISLQRTPQEEQPSFVPASPFGDMSEAERRGLVSSFGEALNGMFPQGAFTSTPIWSGAGNHRF